MVPDNEIEAQAEQPVIHRLRAIVAVEEKDRVRCQEPGCGHSVYAAIHIVEAEGRLQVLGSKCFAKRYGSSSALGPAQFGAGHGRKLTTEEREMLLRNTEILLARFQAEAMAADQAQLARENELRHRIAANNRTSETLRSWESPRRIPDSARIEAPQFSSSRASPWAWQKTGTSIALFTSPRGEHWVRVQHYDGSQKLVPWPKFPGWELALPSSIGSADESIGAIAVENIVEAIQALQKCGFHGPIVGAWTAVLPLRQRN